MGGVRKVPFPSKEYALLILGKVHMQSPYSVILYGVLQSTPMFPTHPLRKRRAFLFFHSIQFILSTFGNPMKRAQFLKTLPTPTLIAHIKKSDIRGNLGAISLKKKQKQDETLSSFRKYWFYILLSFSHLLVHIPMLISLPHTSACGGTTPTWTSHLCLVAWHIFFHFFSPWGPAHFIPSFLVHLSHVPPWCSYITSHIYPHLVNFLHIPECPEKRTRQRDWRHGHQFQFCHWSVVQSYALVFSSV